MTFDTRWDINKYRYPHEVPTYWEMKKKFMLNNKKKFPEDRLVCLAQMFYNMKAMGCRYDPNVTEEINRLSSGIVDDERVNSVRKRQTFVPASDAVHAKVTRQGLSSILGPGQQQQQQQYNDKRQQWRGSGGTNPNQYVSFVRSEEGYNSSNQRYGGGSGGAAPPSSANNRSASRRPQQEFEKRYNTTSYLTSASNQEEDDPMGEIYEGCKYREDGSTPLQLPRGASSMENNSSVGMKRKKPSQEMGYSTGGGGYSSSLSPPKQPRRHDDPHHHHARAATTTTTTGTSSSAPATAPRIEDCDLRRAPLGAQLTPQALPAFFGNMEATGAAAAAQPQPATVNAHHCSGWITADNTPRQEPRKIDRLNVQEVMDSGPFGRLVVFESSNSGGEKDESPVSIICRTASAAHVDAKFSFTNDNNTNVNCRLLLGGMFLASGKGTSQKAAKEAACVTALQRLRETSFTVKVKAPYVNESSRPVDRTLKRKTSGCDRWGAQASIDTPLHEDNIGRKMMKLMGWSGGGLGKNQQGLLEPIRPNDRCVNRSGMGITNSQDFRRKVQNLLQDFTRSESKNDLVFSADFTKDERKMIHEMVRKYNLKSRSFGRTEEARHIVVFKKITPQEIVDELIRCGGETQKYLLIPPTAT